MEINGFKIETWNQYGLDEKVKYSVCPLCSADRKKATDKCAMLDWVTGRGYCNHCTTTFQLHSFAKRKIIEKKEYSVPENYNSTKLSDRMVKWFEGRGISQLTVAIMKIGEGVEYMPQRKEKVNTMQFNYFMDEVIVNIKYRDSRKNFKLFKDAKLVLYNIDAIRICETCVICEGEMDALSFIEAGVYNVVSVPNGATIGKPNLEYIDNCIDHFNNKTKIVIALDNDEAGRHTAGELIRRFGSDICYSIDLRDCKDANEFLMKYGKGELKKAYDDVKEVPLIGVSSVLDWEAEYDEYLANGMNSGFKTGLADFDKIFSTYTSQFISVTGKPSAGKSDFVDMMCIGYNLVNGWKIAYASPENKPSTIHAGKLEAKLVGRWVNKADIQSDWHKKAKEHINDNFKFIDLETFDLDEVFEKTKGLVRRHGIKCLVIDPYNKVRLKRSLNKNIVEYTGDYLVAIDEFCRKHDILVILVAHPRKPSVGESASYRPTFYDIKGGGEFYDMSPHGLAVHRNFNDNSVEVETLKVKFAHLGKIGEVAKFRWNANNGRYMKSLQDGMFEMDTSNWLSKDAKDIFPEPIPNPVEDVLKPNAKFSDFIETDPSEPPF
jgi:twinkle protein